MFGEWTDPYDIDHYYGGVSEIFDKVVAYQNPTKPSNNPSTILAPAQIESASGTPSQGESAPVVKSGFEVTPNSMFMDGHMVGAQPEYNILRSGPPARDGYTDRYPRQYMMCPERSLASTHIHMSSDIMVILLWIVVGLLMLQVIKLSATVRVLRMVAFDSLMQKNSRGP